MHGYYGNNDNEEKVDVVYCNHRLLFGYLLNKEWFLTFVQFIQFEHAQEQWQILPMYSMCSPDKWRWHGDAHGPGAERGAAPDLAGRPVGTLRRSQHH